MIWETGYQKWADLRDRADSICPAIERDMSLLIDDRFDEIGMCLGEMVEAPRGKLVQALQRVVCLREVEEETESPGHVRPEPRR